MKTSLEIDENIRRDGKRSDGEKEKFRINRAHSSPACTENVRIVSKNKFGRPIVDDSSRLAYM